MSRQTTKALRSLIANHDAQTRYWATRTEGPDGEPISDVYREGMLAGINQMLEYALHNAKCYRGFRYVCFKRHDNFSPAAPIGLPVVDGWITLNSAIQLNSVEEQTRQYFQSA